MLILKARVRNFALKWVSDLEHPNHPSLRSEGSRLKLDTPAQN